MHDANGLYYMRARYYHPELKRFLNRDVLKGYILEGQTLNRYAYVNGDPVSYVDPLGLEKQMVKSNSVGARKLDESNRLNIGAGYRNGDISPRNEGVEFMDANNLIGIKTGSQVEVIVQNPHGFNALEGDIPRIIEPGGLLKIVGGEKNPYFSKIYKMNDEMLSKYGFEYINKGKASDDLMFGIQKTTSGDIFSEKALNKQLEVILRRLE